MRTWRKPDLPAPGENMAGVLLKKSVYFLGMWRTSRLDEELAREIARRAPNVTARHAQLEICTVGVRLITRSGAGESVIRMPYVQDIVINRYEPTCLLCVLKESRKLSIIVCRCYNTRDPSDIVKSFRASKRDSRIIESVTEPKRQIDTDTKRHWTPHYPQDRARTGRQGEIGIRTKDPTRATYTEVCHVGIQTSPQDPDDVSLSLSSIQTGDLREELSHLSEEVKAIKMLIEKTTGVVDDKKTEPRTYHNTDTKGDYVKEPEPKKRENPTFVRGEFVSAKSPGYLSDDVEEVQDTREMFGGRRHSGDAIDSGVRSFSVTDSSVHGEPDEAKYIYHNGSHSEMKDIHIERVDSGEGDFIPHENPSSFSGTARLTTFITAPPGFQSLPAPMRDRAFTSPGRRYHRQPRNILLSSTVPKSIENVYRSTRSHRKAHRYSRQVVTPDVFLSQDGERRPRSHSAHDPNRGRSLTSGEDMELHKSLYKLYNEV